MKNFLFAILLCPLPVFGGLVEEAIEYEQGGVTLEGFHVHDDDFEGKRPSVLVIHQWTGLTDYEKSRSRELAKLGYNVFALDIYGKGIRPKPPAAGKEAGKYKTDRDLFRARIDAGLAVLKKNPRTDPERIAAIGYCFGGTGVLELARSGADVAGVVSFHGGLDAAPGKEARPDGVSASVLVCHGADDPLVPRAEVEGFEKEMRSAGVDWQLIEYGDAVHAFTQKMAGDDKSKGVAYNARADDRSWRHMKDFFSEIFR